MEPKNTATKTVGTTLKLPFNLWRKLRNDATDRQLTMRAVIVERLESTFRKGWEA